MGKRLMNNVRLGIFVIAGVVLLVIALYLVGQNQSFFGANFTVKTKFRYVNGLMPGNNVRFSGIQCGTVKRIDIINDTTIEVVMLINTKTSAYIHRNALVSIGNEGLMGNKVINIIPGDGPAPLIENGGTLQTSEIKGLNDMLETLSSTNDNASVISEELKQLVVKLNHNQVIWSILDDQSIPDNLHQTLTNVRLASQRIDAASKSIDEILKGVKGGDGVAGLLLTDKKAAQQLSEALTNIHEVSAAAKSLTTNLDSIAYSFRTDLEHGNGIAHSLLKDSALVQTMNRSLMNIEKGTASFSEDMEALKHNILLRGYFRKQERKNK